ncbi:MAG: elongation factor EF-2 [Candidatus Micrarchaeota archaeon]|nr:elongation factor EF-2 [Candidatus Micrarchaeota archaeon]MDE1824184.1 elongation factor EF-2 [Candidatus Micrarchaeota archaeon]MDE1849434.1 elongation factor EF-2 [Candidatus Micrarchaeota archaeon]
MVRKEFVADEVAKIMSDLEHVRNVAIIAHVHHGKTTLTDSLLARAGIISKSVAGEALYTNYEQIEKDRRMTIKSANISLAFNYKNHDHIINLIDTPGHVDFGGHVTRSMRAVDGVVLVVDPVEGIMPQTETVLRQALKEKAKPVLFVNKTDRLLNELKLTPEQTFDRLLKLINDINTLILRFAPEEYAKQWTLSVEDGSVCFGSAYKKWAISTHIMKKYKVTFKEIFALTAAGDEKRLQEVAPIDEAVLAMVIEHLPSPKVAQAYRIPNLWHGDKNTEAYKSMVNVDQGAKPIIIIFGVSYDQHSGEIAIGRVFAGTIRKGTEVHISGGAKPQKIQQVSLYMGPDRVIIDQVSAGNIAGIVGLDNIAIGDTVSEEEIEPFEQIRHYSQPVVTKAIEAKDTRDLTKLIEALRELSKGDQTIVVELNQETGEHLVSGMGELHLEVIETKIKDEFKIPITTSEPIVVYRETIEKGVKDVEGKAPNKHSRFYVNVEPLEPGVLDLLESGMYKDGKPKGKAHIEEFIKAGLARDEAKGIVDICNRSLLIDATKGVQYLNEVMELLTEGFEEAMRDGPLAREKCTGIKVSITDATIHEDPVHRGPAQIIPAMRRPIYAGMLTAGVVLLEPKQKLTVNIPQDYLSDMITFLQSRRGQVLDIQQENEQATLVAKMPVAEVIKGFSNEMRGITQGKAIWYPEYFGYEKLPRDLQNSIVMEIRKRKGQPPEPPKPEQFMD